MAHPPTGILIFAFTKWDLMISIIMAMWTCVKGVVWVLGSVIQVPLFFLRGLANLFDKSGHSEIPVEVVASEAKEVVQEAIATGWTAMGFLKCVCGEH